MYVLLFTIFLVSLFYYRLVAGTVYNCLYFARRLAPSLEFIALCSRFRLARCCCGTLPLPYPVPQTRWMAQRQRLMRPSPTPHPRERSKLLQPPPLLHNRDLAIIHPGSKIPAIRLAQNRICLRYVRYFLPLAGLQAWYPPPFPLSIVPSNPFPDTLQFSLSPVPLIMLRHSAGGR